MLAGEPPFPGPTAQVIAARRFTETPRPAPAAAPDVPDAVERAVARALAPGPRRSVRHAPTSSPARWAAACRGRTRRPPCRRAANRPAAGRASPPGSALVLGAGRAASRSAGRTRARRGRPAPKRLAVLPFENLGAAGGRVLRRRNHRRDPGQAGRAARSAGHRLGQLGAVQADRQEPAGDRARAGGGLPPHRQGALGEGRGRRAACG